MVRIFISLCIFALAMTVVTTVIGLSLGDLKTQLEGLRAAKRELVDIEKRLKLDDRNQQLIDTRSELQEDIEDLERTRVFSSVHRLIGIATTLVIVFVNSVSVTYFIGTARWIKEVCETYPLDKQLIIDSRKAKSVSFIWSFIGMVTALLISALGAASDPSSGNLNTERWVDWHLASALGGVALLAFAFYQQWLKINANQRLIERVVAEVRRVREERNLPVG